MSAWGVRHAPTTVPWRSWIMVHRDPDYGRTPQAFHYDTDTREHAVARFHKCFPGCKLLAVVEGSDCEAAIAAYVSAARKRKRK